MVRTGASISIALPLVVMMLSLLPVGIFFVRKVSTTTVLNVLSLLCLFIFCQYLTLTFIQPGSAAIQAGFQLAEFTLVFFLFKLMITSTQVKDILNLVLVSFLSVVTTIYALKGMGAFSTAISLIQAIVLTLLAVYTLIQLINNSQLVLAGEPTFWIAGGLLCYSGMSIFMDAVTSYDASLSKQIEQEKELVLSATAILRLLFFCIAARLVPNRESANGPARRDQT